MILDLKYELNKGQMRSLNLVLNRLLINFEIDIMTAEDQLPEMVLLEWYKKNLSILMFPRESEKIELNAPQCMAFLKVFRIYETETYESFLIQTIVQDIMTMFTGGTPYSQTKEAEKIEE